MESLKQKQTYAISGTFMISLPDLTFIRVSKILAKKLTQWPMYQIQLVILCVW